MLNVLRSIILLKVIFLANLINACYILAATYKMTNATINGVCSGTFTDSDGGGLLMGYSYANNENYIMTFCANPGQYMKFTFTQLDIKSGDHLKIYDGPNISSNLLYDITNQNTVLTVISSGSCITFHFTSDGSGNVFSWNGNWQATIECITPITIDNQATVYTCSSIFMDSGGENNYGSNENFVKTICPENGQTCVRLNFTHIDIEAGMDFLYIYDGNVAAGAPLLTLTGTQASATVTSSFLNCLTVKFVSNGSVNRSGWKATVTCGNCVPQCSPYLTAVAADNCGDSPEICDLNGYCGNTSSSYTVDKPGNFCEGCNLFEGSIENNSWIKFVASDTFATLNIYISHCEDNEGIQVGVYEATNCNNFVLKSDISWTSGAGAPFQPLVTNNFITASGLTPGMTYYIMIDGYAGDVCDYIITAGSGVLIPMIETYSQTICAGDQITLTASGASTYMWTSNPPGTFSNSPSITVQPTVDTWYYCSMTRTNGNCPSTTVVDSIFIDVENCSSTCSVNAGQDIEICPGMSTTLSATATGNGPFTYQWAPASSLDNPSSASPVATPPITTTYTVTITTSNGCTATDAVTVTIGNNLTIQVNPQNAIVCQNGNITLTASGASNYTWAPSLGLSSTTGASVIASPGQPITYTVTGTTSNGCTGTATITINIATPIDISAYPNTDHLCKGETTIINVDFNNVGGGGPYIFSWDNGLGSIVPPFVISPQQTTIYHVTVTDNCGTSDTDQLIVVVSNPPTVSFTAEPVSGCDETKINFIDQTSPVPVSWQWNFGDPNSGTANTSTLQNPSHIYTKPGTYDVMLTVTDAMNCSATLIKEDFIKIYPGIKADFFYEPQNPTELNMNIEFYDNSYPTPVSWYWNFGDSLSIAPPVSNLQNPSWSYSSPGNYWISLEVENIHGCKNSISKQINISADQAWYIPNAFTPNENGINDKFGIFGIGFIPEKYEMYIFNRWGEQIFYSKDINVKWNGKYSTGDYVIDGVYIYLFKFQTIDGVDHVINGFVHVIDPRK